jgi:hypothetical protein
VVVTGVVLVVLAPARAVAEAVVVGAFDAVVEPQAVKTTAVAAIAARALRRGRG